MKITKSALPIIHGQEVILSNIHTILGITVHTIENYVFLHALEKENDGTSKLVVKCVYPGEAPPSHYRFLGIASGLFKGAVDLYYFGTEHV